LYGPVVCRKLIERRQFMALLGPCKESSVGLLCGVKRMYPDIGRIELPQRSEVMTWPSPDRTPGLQCIRLRGEPGPVEGFQTIAEKKKREQEEILLPFLVPWSLTTWPHWASATGWRGDLLDGSDCSMALKFLPNRQRPSTPTPM
jgi:hypothetical protein